MNKRKNGRYQTVEIRGHGKQKAYIPAPLGSSIKISTHIGSRLFRLYGEARAALERMNMVADSTSLQNDLEMVLVHKEALRSSLIEGVGLTAMSVMSYRALRLSSEKIPEKPAEESICNYINSIYLAQQRVAFGKRLLLPTISEAHQSLMAGLSTQHMQPGKLRNIQCWIGNSRKISYVPPPPGALRELMNDLLKFINRNNADPLLCAGLAHLRIGQIHPFADSNGRIGRLLIYMLLRRAGLLMRPVLYLSGYLYNKRQDYTSLLQTSHINGNLEPWLEFYLSGIIEASQSLQTIDEQIDTLAEEDKVKIAGVTENTRLIHQAALNEGVVTIKLLSQQTGLSPTSIARSLARLQEIGIINELTGQRRNRLYVHQRLVDAIDGQP